MGCGKKDEISHNSQPARVNLPPSPASDSEKPVQLIVPKTVYSTPCRKYLSKYAGSQFSSMKVTYTEADLETGSTFERTQFLYLTDDCLSESLIITEAGVFTKTDVSQKPAKITGHLFSFNSVSVTVKNNLLITLFNQDKLCGLENWELGKPVSLKKEASETQCPAKGPDRSERAVFLIPDQNMFYVKGSDGINDRKFNLQKDTAFFRE